MTALTIDQITEHRGDITKEDLAKVEASAFSQLPLAALRSEAGITQAEMARILGKSQAAVSKFEGRGDFLVSTLYRHVKAVGGELKIAISSERFQYELQPIDFGDEFGFALVVRDKDASASLADHARQFASNKIKSDARFRACWKRAIRKSPADKVVNRVLADQV